MEVESHDTGSSWSGSIWGQNVVFQAESKKQNCKPVRPS